MQKWLDLLQNFEKSAKDSMASSEDQTFALHRQRQGFLICRDGLLTAEIESIARPRASRAIVARVVSDTTSAAVAVILIALLEPMREAGLNATVMLTRARMKKRNIFLTDLTTTRAELKQESCGAKIDEAFVGYHLYCANPINMVKK